MSKAVKSAADRRAYWSAEITKAKKRYEPFWTAGEKVVDEYRLQRNDATEVPCQDKYNILYSSTETIRPNMYAQTPMVRVMLRHKDRPAPAARDAVMLLESCLKYVIDEEDFDEVMENAVEDLLLPGMGNAWVRYEPRFEGEQGAEVLIDEQVRIDYLYWQDFMGGPTRGWRTLPWAAKRVWLTKEAATQWFGKDKAAKLKYSAKERTGRTDESEDDVAEVWEIWDKRSKTVFWFCEDYPDDVLDMRPDPLKLNRFFPCPRPMRAISNTRTFIPRALYSQYKTQAETLNSLTKRIRLLTEALRVVGVYDGSNVDLANLLSPNGGNRMIKVNNWAAFVQGSGIKGSVEWLPIEQVVNTLRETLQAREVCKAEIYEITGFSDIVRGVSKASETLGAQNIKQNWAGARVKKMQKEVQRFARDLIALTGEVIAEHCSEATIALFGGIDIPTEEQMATPEVQQLFKRFKAATSMLKTEGRRVAQVNIETDSTILADESMEREDRMKFLSAAGAFLQQAVPAMEQTPELGPLLGAMLMFGVRTFPSSRPIEEEFEKVQQVLANRPQGAAGGDKDGKAADAQAKAAAATGVAQIKAQTEGAKIAETSKAAAAELASKEREAMARIELEAEKERNRHNEAVEGLAFKAREVAVREREVAVREAELGIKQQQADTQEFAAEASANVAQQQADTGERVAEHSASMAEATHEQKYDEMDREDERAAKEPSLTKKPKTD